LLEGRCFAAFLSTRGLVEVWICNDQKMYLTQLGPVKLGLRLGDSATLCLSVVVLLPVSIGIRIHLSPNAQVVLLGGSFCYVFPLWIDCAPTTWLWWVVFEASPDFPFFKRDLNRDKASYSLSQWEGNLCLAINKHALPSFSSWNVLRWSLNFYVSLKGNKKGDSLFLLSRKEVLWLYLFFFLTKLCRSSTVCTLCGAVFTVPQKNKRVTSDMRSRSCGCCFFESQLNCNQFILQKHTGDTTKCAPFFKTTCENNFFESRVFCKSQSERFGLFFSFVDRDSHISVSVVLSL